MPVNILQQVITYNESNLALLLNSFAFISTANMKFQRFNDDVPKNLGDTVSFDLPPRFTTTNSLVVTFQSATQRVQQLTVNKEASTAYEFTAQQFIFNVRDYMRVFGKSAIAELGTQVETDVASLAETNTFRFYGDGVTAISTYLQLANALAFFRNFGAAKDNTMGYLSDLTFPLIVNSGLNQFTPMRADREAMSWEIGDFSKCKWYQSNLLKTHMAGTEGNAGSVLTVVSVVTNSEGGVIQITFSGTAAASDPNSIKAYDKFQFSDGVSGQPDLRFRTFIGHVISQSPVQFRATADAASTSGSDVTVNIYPALQASPGQDQNINYAIVAGMQVTVLPDHRCGLIMAGNPLFLAMPKLPEEVPFPTSVQQDPDSGASIRQYYGSLFGQNQRGMVHDIIWGKTLVDEYSMMVALPI
ncbi:Major capsid protein Gp5 [uncultured Caudovirales phage]|uniref:Major capsid protein Gp5 n=1 Tax=uncultured Caudovirales phage TaxID=2100421 RepID=A0A6J5L508_9CAUD|nr:Major capsid protein Gp5 [uncultured Caudovirales phage]